MFLVGGEGEFDKAVEVFQNLRVSLDRGLPVLVNPTLQGSLCCGDLVRVWRSMIVMIRMGSQSVQVSRMSLLAPVREQTEVLEDVVLCVCSNP